MNMMTFVTLGFAVLTAGPQPLAQAAKDPRCFQLAYDSVGLAIFPRHLELGAGSHQGDLRVLDTLPPAARVSGPRKQRQGEHRWHLVRDSGQYLLSLSSADVWIAYSLREHGADAWIAYSLREHGDTLVGVAVAYFSHNVTPQTTKSTRVTAIRYPCPR